MAASCSATIEELRRDHPNVVPAKVVAQILKKDTQHVRNMAKAGRLPFAVVAIGRHRSSYIFATERFIAWLEGKLT